MRRISAKQASRGMKLLRSVYDDHGNIIFKANTTLSEESLTTLNIYEVGEIIIEDRRVADVPVQPLIAPELQAQALQWLRQLLTEHQGNKSVDSALLDELESVGIEMTRELFPEVIGEVNTSGCPSPGDYPYLQPVKVVELALLIGKRAGYGMNELHPLVMAALLKDVGYAALPSDITGSEESPEAQQHSLHGAEIISGYKRFGPEVAEAVYQHHERWDGSGYPEGLKGKEASAFARILAIADAYYGLVSNRPDRERLMPHEAIEYIMAYSGELFDPELVDIFAKSVPLYPSGIMVRLNAGEAGVVSKINPGNTGRPVVRVFFNKRGRPRLNPYEINLMEAEHQAQLVAEVLDY